MTFLDSSDTAPQRYITRSQTEVTTNMEQQDSISSYIYDSFPEGLVNGRRFCVCVNIVFGLSFSPSHQTSNRISNTNHYPRLISMDKEGRGCYPQLFPFPLPSLPKCQMQIARQAQSQTARQTDADGFVMSSSQYFIS